MAEQKESNKKDNIKRTKSFKTRKCWNFNTNKGCTKGDKCPFRHVRDAQKEKSEINPYLDAKLITNINDEIQKTKSPKVSTDNQTEKPVQDKLKRSKSYKSKKICWNFNSKKGCNNGDECRYKHIKYNDVVCPFFNTEKGCLYGDKCQYKHIADNKNKNQAKSDSESSHNKNKPLQTEQQDDDDNKLEEIRMKGTKSDRPQEQSLPDKSPESSKSPKVPKTTKSPKEPKTPLKKDKIKRTKSDKPHASKPNLSAKDKAEKKEQSLPDQSPKSPKSPTSPKSPQSPTSFPSEKHDLPKEAEMMEDLRLLSNTWYQNNDVNVENLGLYLKAVLDGYEANMDYNKNHGYVKYGTYARTFCEVICNYILGEKSLKLMLHRKCLLMEEEKIIYPKDSMNFVRKNTNRIVHGVHFGESAAKRYIPKGHQREILKNIYIIAKWVTIKNSKKDLNEVRVD